MINVAILRGDYLNNFELQNYNFLDDSIKITAFASKNPIHQDFSFPSVFLPSLPNILGMSFIANRLIGDRQILLGLESHLTSFDIIHTADPHYYYSYQAAQLRAKNKINKLIVTSWETIPHNNETVAQKKQNKYFVMKHADKFLCYTERARSSLISEGVTPSKITVIPLGVDLKRFSPQVRKQKSLERLTLLFVGRLVEEKGILDLYSAFKKIRKSSSQMQYLLRIVGAGPLEKKLQVMIQEDDLSKYVSIEKKSYEEMPKVYQEADIFIMPSKTIRTWEEQYGMVLIEALASGIPVIAYNSGSIAELLSGKGILVEEGSINGLINAITNLEDLDKRLEYGKAALHLAIKKYDAAQVSYKLAQFYAM